MAFPAIYITSAASLRVRLSKSSSGAATMVDADLEELAKQASRLVKSLVREQGVAPPATGDADGLLEQASIEAAVAIIEGSFWIRAGDVQTVERAMPLYMKSMISGYVNSVRSSSTIFGQGTHDPTNYEKN